MGGLRSCTPFPPPVGQQERAQSPIDDAQRAGYFFVDVCHCRLDRRRSRSECRVVSTMHCEPAIVSWMRAFAHVRTDCTSNALFLSLLGTRSSEITFIIFLGTTVCRKGGGRRWIEKADMRAGLDKTTAPDSSWLAEPCVRAWRTAGYGRTVDRHGATCHWGMSDMRFHANLRQRLARGLSPTARRQVEWPPQRDGGRTWTTTSFVPTGEGHHRTGCLPARHEHTEVEAGVRHGLYRADQLHGVREPLAEGRCSERCGEVLSATGRTKVLAGPAL